MTDRTLPAKPRSIGNENKPKFLCRVLGHRWVASHRHDVDKFTGCGMWVYTDHVCTRCWMTEWRMPT